MSGGRFLGVCIVDLLGTTHADRLRREARLGGFRPDVTVIDVSEFLSAHPVHRVFAVPLAIRGVPGFQHAYQALSSAIRRAAAVSPVFVAAGDGGSRSVAGYGIAVASGPRRSRRVMLRFRAPSDSAACVRAAVISAFLAGRRVRFSVAAPRMESRRG